MNKLLLSTPEAMSALGGIGRTKLYELIDTGEIARVKIGRRTFVTSKSIAGYVDKLSDC